MTLTITLPRSTVEQALEAMEEACEIIGAAWAWRDEKGKPTITALRAALAQQGEAVEPVAWVNVNHLQGLTLGLYGYVEIYTDESHGRIPLYAAPPQRKPLPNHDQHCVDVPGYGLMAVRLVRAVERAHGIKE